MNRKKDHHYTMLIGAFILVALAAAIIFITQFNAQVGEAGRLVRVDNTKIDDAGEIKIGTPQKNYPGLVIPGEPKKPTIDGSAWEDAWKRGMLVDPGYGIPDVSEFEDVIIVVSNEYEPKLVLYDPKWHDKIIDIFKPSPPKPSTPIEPGEPKPAKPATPSLEELGRIIKSPNGYTCYYDENGNFVRAWKVSRIGNNVEINEDPNGRHRCPKTVQVKKIEIPPIISADGTTINN